MTSLNMNLIAQGYICLQSVIKNGLNGVISKEFEIKSIF